ncbi:MAG: hypothetical protein JWL76_686 [Thermoleophilia bacterium]|nr:hypothetical protein [Thermoleophilia bacterium]
MTSRTWTLVSVLAVAIATGATTASASQMIDPADSADLLEMMQDATADQGVCYQWTLNLDDQYTYQGGIQDEGDTTTPGGCAKGTVILTGSASYSCGTCEAGDSASVSLQGIGVSVVASSDDYLDGLGLSDGDLLDDENDDVAWFNMVGGLPLMVSESNPSIPAPTFDETIYPADDARPTDTPSAIGDWFRVYGWSFALVVLGIGALVVGGLWIRKQRSTAA